jgi:hypothetical protein
MDGYLNMLFYEYMKKLVNKKNNILIINKYIDT